jgi:branched-chain amino acid transport system substrate-binding protein
VPASQIRAADGPVGITAVVSGSVVPTGSSVPGAATPMATASTTTALSGAPVAGTGAAPATSAAGTASSGPVGTSGQAGSGGIPGDIITASCNGTATGTIKLGNVFPYSVVGAGPTFYEARQLLGAWADYVNRHGGICGRTVQVLIRDDGGSASQTAADYKDLTENEKVSAFLMSASTLTLSSYESYVESKQIPVIGGDMESGVYNRSPVFFPQGSSVTEQDYGLYKVGQLAPNGTKVAFLYCIEVSTCSNNFKFQVDNHIPEAVGSQIVYSKQVSLTQISFTAECQAAQKAGAGVLLAAGDASFLQRIANSCGQAGIQLAYLAPYIVAADALTKNAYLNGHTYTSTQTQPWLATNTPGSRMFAQITHDYNIARTGAGMLMWADVLLAQQALTAIGTGAVTPASVLNALQTRIKNFDIGGLVAPITFHTGGQDQLQCEGESLIQNGAWQLLNNGSLTCRSGPPGPLPNP